MPPRRRIFPGSLRFRLTAWYALLLAAVLVVLGFSVIGLTEDRLNRDVDRRLARTAADIENTIWKPEARPDVDWAGDRLSLEEVRLNLDSFVSRGLKVLVLDAHGAIVKDSPYAERLAYPVQTTPLEKGSHSLETISTDGMDLRVLRFPVVARDGGEVVGTVVVGEPLDYLYSTLTALRRTLLGTSVAGLVLAVLGGWLLADRALRPVDRVTATAATIATGDGTAASLGTRLRVPDTGDELARLSATFNAMLDRLQAAFVAQQRFVADASHELRTPLTAIRGNVEVLSRQMAARGAEPGIAGDFDAAVADMQRESARMGRLLEDLLLLARSDAPEGAPHHPRPVRLDLLARDAVRGGAALATGQRMEVVAPEAITIEGDPDRLLQLLLILLENAIRHTPAGSAITVEVQPPNDGLVRLIVRDEGEGIAPEHLPHLFDRFYRADGARGRATGGTGLGLAIARTIVRSHGGEIAVASAPGKGTTFTVTLPSAPSGDARVPQPTALSAPRVL